MAVENSEMMMEEKHSVIDKFTFEEEEASVPKESMLGDLDDRSSREQGKPTLEETASFEPIEMLRSLSSTSVALSALLNPSLGKTPRLPAQLCDSAHVHSAASQTSKYAVVYLITLTG